MKAKAKAKGRGAKRVRAARRREARGQQQNTQRRRRAQRQRRKSSRPSRALVSEALWAVIEPLLPKQRRSRKGGRPPVPNRAALTGILFVLQTGIPWEYLPQEMGCGSGVTCWRRLRAWQKRGVWKRLHRVLLERLAAADRIDWSRAVVDSRSLPAKRGAATPAGTRRTKANRARSNMLFRMPRASRSPAA